jgi:hypothetical protein
MQRTVEYSRSEMHPSSGPPRDMGEPTNASGGGSTPAAEETLSALGRAADSNAERDTEFARSVRFYRRGFLVACLALLVTVPAIVYGAVQSHENRSEVHQVLVAVNNFDMRSSHNEVLLLCTATSERAIAKDVRTLIASQATAPTSAYPLPGECKVAAPAEKK